MASALATIRRGITLKATGTNSMPFPAYGSGFGLSSWLGTRFAFDPRKVPSGGLENSIVTNTLRSKVRAFTEPIVREYRRVEQQYEEVEASPAADLLARPNSFMSDEDLWAYSHAAIAARGSAYIHKVRNARNQPIELWPLYPAFVKPHTPASGDVFMDYWEYSAPGQPTVKIPVGDVIQLRLEIDPADHRVGRALLADVLAEIYGDDEALRFSTALLTNMGVPGVIMTPRDPADPGPPGPIRDQMVAEYKEKFSGQKRGEPLIVGGGGGMTVSVVAFSPEQMNFTALRKVPEERISGALGWPAILAGLGAGLDRGTYSNAEQLREYSTEATLISEWRTFGKSLTRQLLSEFTPATDRLLMFDLSEVRALQKDENSTIDRLNTGVTGGWVMVSEARREAGLPIEDSHEVFLRSASVIEVDPDGDVQDPFDTGEDDAEGVDPFAPGDDTDDDEDEPEDDE